jgi:hypothetical protein
LKPDLDGGLIGNGIDGLLHRCAHVDIDLAQDGQWNGAETPVRGRSQRFAGLGGVFVHGRHAAPVLLERRHFGVESDEIADFTGENTGDHVHAADRLEQSHMELVVGTDEHGPP